MRLMLHIKATALLAPCLLLFTDSLPSAIIGVAYAAALLNFSAKTDKGRRFFRAYYHEILHLENKL